MHYKYGERVTSLSNKSAEGGEALYVWMTLLPVDEAVYKDYMSTSKYVDDKKVLRKSHHGPVYFSTSYPRPPMRE